MTGVLEDVGTINATWTDPTGTVWSLSDNSDAGPGWFTPPGPAGWHATQYEIVTDALARGGESVRTIRAKPGRLVWPIYVFGDTHMQYVERHRQIRRAITMTAHRKLAGVMRVTRPDLSAREIDCIYESGMEGESGEGHMWSKDAVVLYCPDGYWRDTPPITVPYSYVAGSNFLNPFPKVSAAGLGEATVTNPGDVDAWPTTVITGPASAVTATNITTGYEWTVTWPLGAGEQITITTQRPTVRGPAGQNLVTALDWPTAYLWGLAPGDNAVIFNVSGGAPGTSVQMTFYPRHEGA